MKYQLQFQYPEHSKGPDYWQPTTATYRSLESAERARAQSQKRNPTFNYRIVRRA